MASWWTSLDPRGRLLAGLVAAIVGVGAITAIAAVAKDDGSETVTADAGSTSSSSSTSSTATTAVSASPDGSSTTSTTALGGAAGGATTTALAGSPGPGRGPTTTTTVKRASGGGAATTAPSGTAPATTTACALPGDAGYANQLASRFEGYRSSQGLPAMARTAKLDAVALEWARHLACGHLKSLPHNPNLKSDVLAACGTCNGWAENVAWDSGGADSMWSAWLGSAPHLKNISDAHDGEYGIAVVKGTDGSWYGVQDFGRYP